MRLLPEADFARIIDRGLTPLSAPEAIPRQDEPPEAHRGGFDEAPAGFGRNEDRMRVLTSRTLREQSFARQVKVAYQGRCAMSGLSLRNGGGRAEVNAAHIRPVASKGPDIVQNGLALSGTLHWMFDRGLVSVDEDHSILVAQGSLAGEVQERLLTADRKLILPPDQLQRPHAGFLAWHRRNVFKG
jgi:putative restriction endonuclease